MKIANTLLHSIQGRFHLWGDHRLHFLLNPPELFAAQSESQPCHRCRAWTHISPYLSPIAFITIHYIWHKYSHTFGTSTVTYIWHKYCHILDTSTVTYLTQVLSHTFGTSTDTSTLSYIFYPGTEQTPQ